MIRPTLQPPTRAEGAAFLLGGDRRTWQRRYVQLLIGLDALLLTLVTVLAVVIRFGAIPTAPNGLSYGGVALGVLLFWLLGLAAARCYEVRFVLSEADELRQVVKATVEVFAAVALVSFLTRAEVSRAYVLLTFPVGLTALLLNRLIANRLLSRARAAGQAQHRVLIVGDEAGLEHLATALTYDPQHGHRVVAACLPGGSAEHFYVIAGQRVPLASTLSALADAVRDNHVDTVAVAAGALMSDSVLRQVSYDLEGLDVDLLVAPSLADVAGTRISVRPVGGLPLFHLDEPELDGAHKFLKGAFDRSLATVGLLLLLPVLAGIYLAVCFSGPGGVLFKQDRVGRDGQLFKVWKFRSMYPDAEARLAELMEFNDHNGPLFKMKNDPRITPIGRFLRKWSLDELPQLVNVFRGDMSLVGPRPPLPSEVAKYDGHAERRLLVKPGITGLWQVSGRSDLDWEQAVRLDVAYVDGWSLGFDLAILARTAIVVFKGSGAY